MTSAVTSPLITGLLLIIKCWLEPSPPNADFKVSLAIDETTPLAIGGSRSLKITYRNVTDRAVTMMDPRTSFGAIFSAKCETSKGSLKGRGMGKASFFPVKGAGGAGVARILV